MVLCSIPRALFLTGKQERQMRTLLSNFIRARLHHHVGIPSALPLILLIKTTIDDFKTLQGAPCAIQVFTPTMRDEECLEMTKTIDNCLKH